MMVTLPALLLLLDFWPRRRLRTLRDGVPLALEKWPLWLLTFAFSGIAVLTQSSETALAGLDRLPLDHRLPNAVMSYGRYLVGTLWPLDLAAFYPYPVDGWPTWQWVATAIALAAITAALWLVRERYPSLIVGWAFYGVSLSPVSGVMQTGGQAMADRFTYLPTIGLVLGVVGALPALLAQPERRRIAGVAAAVACAILAVLTWVQTGYWRDTVTLMRHAVDVTDFNLYARSSLAHAHLARGETEVARQLYEEVLQVRPDIAQVNVNLGIIAAGKGDYPRAIEYYGAAIRADERNYEAYNNLGAALIDSKRSQEATQVLERAAQLRPDDPDVLFNLGMAQAQSGNVAAAAQTYERVAQLAPRDAESRFRAGVLRQRLGDRAAAEQHLRAALALQPNHAQASEALRQLQSAPATAP
jgi:tetratricopeptide (TPR) repeat protein